ncbi:MAG: class I SAM-dependent methyltransferase [Deltaproteobacteria bacterium]|nr:class I SAM-dependent methyltransferase [Deltaproteobacteria bacterium]
MSYLPFSRRLLKKVHPEGIPLIGTVLYNRLSKTGLFTEHYKKLAHDIITQVPTGRLLDVGTGPGFLLEQIRLLSPALSLTGLDISPAMVERAAKNLAHLFPPPEIVLGDASGLPFPDNSFDAVVSTGSFHHWKAPVEGLNEIHRVLKPGGRALIYDLVSDTPKDVIRKMAAEFGRLRVFLFWLHAFEEPFYAHRAFLDVAHDTLFRDGEIRWVGALCCLSLKKSAM